MKTANVELPALAVHCGCWWPCVVSHLLQLYSLQSVCCDLHQCSRMTMNPCWSALSGCQC